MIFGNDVGWGKGVGPTLLKISLICRSKDETIIDILKFVSNDNTQNYLFCRLKRL